MSRTAAFEVPQSRDQARPRASDDRKEPDVTLESVPDRNERSADPSPARPTGRRFGKAWCSFREVRPRPDNKMPNDIASVANPRAADGSVKRNGGFVR